MPFESVHDLFDRVAAEHPRRPAVDRSGETLTYRDVQERSNRIARFLADRGVGPGDRVALLTEDSFRLVPAILGVLKSGAAFLPLDPRFPARRLERMVRKAQPALLLTGARSAAWQADPAAVAADGAVPLIGLGEPAGDGSIALDEGPEERPDLPPADPDGLAYVYFTSGSSGEPKGIAGRLRAIDHFIRWEIDTFDLGPGVRVSQLTTPAFDAYLRDVFVPLCCGGTVCVPEDRDTVLDGRRLTEWLDLEEIALAHMVPSLFRSLLAEELSADWFAELRYVLLAGETVLPSDVARWTDVFGERIRLVNLYGPSETTMTKFFHVVQAADRERRSVPIGRPIRGARALLLDPRGQVTPPGSIGEIYIRTPYRSLGYLEDPAATRAAFVQNPFNDDPDDLVFRTGDMGRVLEDGSFEFLGRRDQQVKIQGVRVELGEIESLLRTQPGVRDVVVVDREEGTGGRTLYAYLVAAESGLEFQELRDELRRSLPETMVPSAFVVMEELPRTLTGKVDRKALPEPSQVVPGGARIVEPRDPVEELLAEIWRDLLRIQSVGVDTSFFELGGHSLLVTQLLSRIRAAFEVSLPLDLVFESPTIGALAERIREARLAGGGASVPPLVPRDGAGDPPLSFAQERLWILDRLEPGNPAYNVPTILELEGPLEVAALRRGLEVVIGRHETLRTSFPAVAGRPVQRIHPPGPVALPVVDLGALPEGARASEARRIARREALLPFELTRETTLRSRLLRLAPEDHLLLVTLHHIGSDDWSAALLVQEWSAAYAALAEGRTPDLPVLEVQYADYAVWQRGWIEGDVLDDLLRFWRGELDGVARLTDLPLDRSRPARATFRGGRERIRLSGELTEAVRGLARRQSVTPFMVLMAAFQAVLWRNGAQSSFAVGTPIAGRNHVALERLIGFFINNLCIRSDLAGAPSFRDHLARQRRIVLDAFVHQDLPFEKLVAELSPDRDPSVAPLFQVVFALHNTGAAPAPGAGELAVQNVPLESDLVKADLDLDLIELDGRLTGNLWFNGDLFDRSTAARLAAHLERLLTAVTDDPDQPLAFVPLLDPEQRRQLLVDWQGQKAPVDERESLSGAVARLATEAPDRVAIERDRDSLTYGALDRRANQLARYLRSLGVGREMVVATALERGPDLVVALLAILRAGGAYLPLDTGYPTQRLQTMLEDAGVSVLVTTEDSPAALPVFYGFPVSLDGAAEMIGEESSDPLPDEPLPDQLAYVIYTSGSTGRPKGVQISHRGLSRVTRLFGRFADPGDRVLQFASPGFDASISEIVTAAGSGATLVTSSGQDLLPGPSLTRLLRRHRVGLATLPPSTLAVLRETDLPDLQELSSAGEACSAEIVRRWGGARSFNNLYGPTEATIWSTRAVCSPDGGEPTLGRPIEGVRVSVVGRSGELVPRGVPGELLLGGPLARGYLNRPGRTAETFVPDAFFPDAGGRLYRTGDRVRWTRDGELQFFGRVDQQVKLRGFRIELGEVESVLMEHPGVANGAVVLRPGSDRLTAYWVAADRSAPTADELIELLSRRLPSHAVPADLVRLDEMPLTSSNKVDRRALAERDVADRRLRAYRRPRGPVEELVTGLWEEILGVERIGVDDDFFDLGGSSLAAAQVLAGVQELWGVEVPIDRLFDHPTPAAFALRVEELIPGSEPGTPTLAHADRSGPQPVTLGQQLMWERGGRDLDGARDHVHAFLEIGGDLDVETLSRAYQEIVRRHEVLRTALREERGELVQEVLPFEAPPLTVVELTSLPPGEGGAALDRALRSDQGAALDLAGGRPYRCRLYRLAEDRHVLSLVCHHAVSDPWSAVVFSRELGRLYGAFLEGEGSPLPELPVQMVDFAHWQRRWLDGEGSDERLRHWLRVLAGARPIELPLDRPRTGAAAMGRVGGTLPAEEVEALRAIGRGAGATLFITLLSSFYVLLHHLTGERDLTVWSPMGNRPRRELEPLIGFFPHATVLRHALDPQLGFRDLVGEVRRTVLGAFGHRGVPYEVLWKRLFPDLGVGEELLRVSSNYIHDSGVALELPDLRVRAYDLEIESSMEGDLELLFRERGDILRFDFNFPIDRLDESTVTAWSAAWRRLLDTLLESPDCPVDELRAVVAGDTKLSEAIEP